MSTFLRALVKGTVPTTDSAVDYTSSEFSGVTPKAAVVCVCHNTGLDEDSSGCRFSLGYYTSAAGAYFRMGSEDNVSPTDSEAKLYNSMEISLTAPFGGRSIIGDVSLISGGVRINYFRTNGTEYRVFVLLFGGDAIPNVTLATASGPLANGAENTVSVGHPTGFLLSLSQYGSAFDGMIDGISQITGFAANSKEGTVYQASVASYGINAVAPSDEFSAISNDNALVMVDTNAIISSIQLDKFTSSGFDENVLYGDWSGDRAYLCFELASDMDAEISYLYPPAGAAVRDITGLSHTPRMWLTLAGLTGTFNNKAGSSLTQFQAAVENGGSFVHQMAAGDTQNNNDPSTTKTHTKENFSLYKFGGRQASFLVTATEEGQYTEDYSDSSSSDAYATLTIGENGLAPERVRDFMPFFANMI